MTFRRFFSGCCVSIFLLACTAQAAWVPIGPFGGGARSLAADPEDPNRMYVGTSTGQIFASSNGGRTWERLSSLQAPENWVVDKLIMDTTRTQVLYAAMWSLTDGGGGIFKTEDGGRTWQPLRGIYGQSVRSLAVSRSNAQVLVAGTLEGVFRSLDAGASWHRISPLGHAEIHSVHSVAIDPKDPQIIYAGTWHLPWKTTDGGGQWVSIKRGMLDDSDVFAIEIHPTRTNIVYAAACSGIYRSDNGGAQWRKIQGIPQTSRRTHTLVLDPRDPEIVLAGTTEGLWRSPDGGQAWERLTPHSWVINAVVHDPREQQHFFLAMERGGVMETWDGGRTFRGANVGFSQRQISRILTDPADKNRFFISVLHDAEFGGVFSSSTRGASWEQLSAGLGGRDVSTMLIIAQPEWRLLAGTPEGVFEYTPESAQWQNRSQWNTGSNAKGQAPFVRDLHQSRPGAPIYAATSAGLFESSDGRSWTRLPLEAGLEGLYAVSSFGRADERLVAATSIGLALSHDKGRSWKRVGLDGKALRIQRLVSHPKEPDTLFAATESGLFRSKDGGETWAKHGRGLPVSAKADVLILSDNPERVLVAGSAGAFYSVDGGEWYNRIGSSSSADGLPLTLSALQLLDGNEIVAASSHSGLFFHDGSNTGLNGTSNHSH